MKLVNVSLNVGTTVNNDRFLKWSWVTVVFVNICVFMNFVVKSVIIELTLNALGTFSVYKSISNIRLNSNLVAAINPVLTALPHIFFITYIELMNISLANGEPVKIRANVTNANFHLRSPFFLRYI
jgi:hypothetical protein